MEAALEAARAKDTKQRLAGVERLHEALEAAARRGLTSAEVTSLVDACMDLTKDGNFRVAQGGLQALSAAAVLAGDHFKIHLNALVPAAVERLGDGKQPVRDAARQLLVTLMEVWFSSLCRLLLATSFALTGLGLGKMRVRLCVYLVMINYSSSGKSQFVCALILHGRHLRVKWRGLSG
jgi:hypothetical protein